MKTKETKGERRRRDGILLPGDGHEEYRAVVGASIHQVFHHFHYSPPAPLARPVMLTLPAAIWHSGKFPSLKGRYIFHPRRNFAVFAATGRLIKRGRVEGDSTRWDGMGKEGRAPEDINSPLTRDHPLEEEAQNRNMPRCCL